MRKFLSALILVPLGLILVVFAVANREFVTLSFDPFNAAEPALSVRLPLFVLLTAAAVLGVIAGGLATWVRQRHWRRSARRSEAELRQLRRAGVQQPPAQGYPPALPPAA
jgi:uncharacterized integral membrane protein